MEINHFKFNLRRDATRFKSIIERYNDANLNTY